MNIKQNLRKILKDFLSESKREVYEDKELEDKAIEEILSVM
jgi:hypothetical protein